jgi:hypothetical protein
VPHAQGPAVRGQPAVPPPTIRTLVMGLAVFMRVSLILVAFLIEKGLTFN